MVNSHGDMLPFRAARVVVSSFLTFAANGVPIHFMAGGAVLHLETAVVVAQWIIAIWCNPVKLVAPPKLAQLPHNSAQTLVRN